MLAVLLAAVALAAAPAGDHVAALTAAALAQTRETVVYDGAYVRIPYPGGDVPAGRGVCTDVVVRAYRKLGADLQVLVHEDMKKHFGLYPKNWGRRAPDTNIDHRRVPNLMTFFARHGETLPKSRRPADYAPGDIVAWDLGGGLTHIGLLVDQRGRDGRPLVVHNIGRGPQLEDVLFDWKVIGHYRYRPRQVILRPVETRDPASDIGTPLDFAVLSCVGCVLASAAVYAGTGWLDGFASGGAWRWARPPRPRCGCCRPRPWPRRR